MSDTLLLGNEYTVFRVGLGTNRVTDDERSKHALKKAVELGITFIDTASAYTSGKSEQVIGETLAPYPHGLVVATKGGMHAPGFHVDVRPEALEEQLEQSLIKLKLETIPLYFLHRIDPNVPFKEQMIFLKQVQEEGKIKHIGLSEVSVDQLEEAKKYITIAAIENEYNLSERKHDAVIGYAEKNNIVFVPFFPLHFTISDTVQFKTLQDKYHATESQLAIAWLLKRSPLILPIPGSLSPEHLEENIKATQIDLSEEDYKTLSEIAA